VVHVLKTMVDPPACDSIRRGLRPRLTAEFTQNMADVQFDGPCAQMQSLSDLSIGAARSQMKKHLHFAPGQSLHGLTRL
jgi:hypothetical protein